MGESVVLSVIAVLVLIGIGYWMYRLEPEDEED